MDDSTQWYCERCGYHGSVSHASVAGVYAVARQVEDAHRSINPACFGIDLIRVWTSDDQYVINQSSPAPPNQPTTIKARLVQRGDMPPTLSGKADPLIEGDALPHRQRRSD